MIAAIYPHVTLRKQRERLAEYLARSVSVRRRLPEDLQLACAIAYTYGWRMPSEVLTLRLSQVDLKAGRCGIEPGMTKHDDGRLRVPHPGARVAPGQLARVEALGRQLGPARIIPYLSSAAPPPATSSGRACRAPWP